MGDNSLLDELIKEVVGEDALLLVHYIKDKQDVSEFKIAERLNLGINQIRNILYRLSNHNLVSFIRKKDRKKGWYIYYWTFNVKQANELLMKLKHKKLEQLRIRLNELGKESFFVCPNDDLTLSFEAALEHHFKCPEDGEVLVQKDSAKEEEKIKNEIARLEADIAHGLVIEVKRRKKVERAKKGKKLKKKIKKKVHKKLSRPRKKVKKKKHHTHHTKIKKAHKPARKKSRRSRTKH